MDAGVEEFCSSDDDSPSPQSAKDNPPPQRQSSRRNQGSKHTQNCGKLARCQGTVVEFVADGEGLNNVGVYIVSVQGVSRSRLFLHNH